MSSSMVGESSRYDEYGVPFSRVVSHPSLPVLRILTNESPSLSIQSFDSFYMSSLSVIGFFLAFSMICFFLIFIRLCYAAQA